MPDSQAKRDWMRENTSVITVKLNNRTDADILDWLARSGNKQGAIKDAIRKYLNSSER